MDLLHISRALRNWWYQTLAACMQIQFKRVWQRDNLIYKYTNTHSPEWYICSPTDFSAIKILRMKKYLPVEEATTECDNWRRLAKNRNKILAGDRPCFSAASLQLELTTDSLLIEQMQFDGDRNSNRLVWGKQRSQPTIKFHKERRYKGSSFWSYNQKLSRKLYIILSCFFFIYSVFFLFTSLERR